jgi:predicted outer membrane repeat protein
MDDARFDRLTRSLGKVPASRRVALGLLGSLAALGIEEAAAKRRRRKPTTRKAPAQCRPSKACTKWCTSTFGADPAAARQCITEAAKCQGPCAQCGPGCTTGCTKLCGLTCQACCDDGDCTGGQTCKNGQCATNCLAPNAASDDGTQGLQTAIALAEPGSTLKLCAGTWKLTTQAVIGKDLTLEGAGSDKTSLDGQRQTRVLLVELGATVRLDSLAVEGGYADDACISDSYGGTCYPEDSYGGGIYNNGTLTLKDSAVRNNKAYRAGGGIANLGTLTLANGSVVSGNTAWWTSTDNGGGGIWSQGPLTLEGGSTVSDNTATEHGGGIYSKGTLTLKAGSTVTRNSILGYGVGSGVLDELTFKAEDGAIICGNTPLDRQCYGHITGGGSCPSTQDGKCPSPSA